MGEIVDAKLPEQKELKEYLIKVIEACQDKMGHQYENQKRCKVCEHKDFCDNLHNVLKHGNVTDINLDVWLLEK